MFADTDAAEHTPSGPHPVVARKEDATERLSAWLAERGVEVADPEQWSVGEVGGGGYAVAVPELGERMFLVGRRIVAFDPEKGALEIALRRMRRLV